MSVDYEWDVEEVSAQDTDDLEEGEILDHRFQDNFAGCLKLAATEPPQGSKWRIVLVRTTDNPNADEVRTWACLEDDGTLPEFFSNSGGDDATKVPKRFHEEVAKANAKAKA